MYQSPNYFRQGDGALVIGGTMIIEEGADVQGGAPSISEPADAIADLAGTLTGTTDGTLANVAAVSTAGGNTYSDAAINTAITAVNLQLKELQEKLNATLAALRETGVIAE